MSYTTFNEVLKDIKTVEDMQKKLNMVMVELLKFNFADWVWLDLPEGTPPYKELNGGPDLAYEKLVSQRTSRMFSIWMNKEVKQIKRESLFIEYLESLYAEEAKLLVAIKDKKVSEMFPNITRELFDAAFPNELVIK